MSEHPIWTMENITIMNYSMSEASEAEILEDYTILVTIKGDGEACINGRSLPLSKAGAVLFCNPGTKIRFSRLCPRRGLQLYKITVGIYEKSHLENRAVYEKSTREFYPSGRMGTANDAKIADLAERMELLSRENRPANTFKIQMWFQECLHLLSQEYEETAEASAESVITEVTAYIQEHYDEDINRCQLAQMAGLNQEYFSRLFKKQTGCNFNKYLSETRIKKAQEYLLTSKASLKEIAQRVGYKNEFYLSQKFKQVTGIAPTAYIKMPKKIASVSSNYTGCLLALGITPVVAKINPFIENLFHDHLDTNRVQTIDLLTFRCSRMIAEARPDLVICNDNYAELEELKRIAPTISISLFKQNWREQLLTIASIVSAENKAREWLGRFDEKVDRAKRCLDAKLTGGTTVGIYEIWKDKIIVFGDSYGRGGHIIYQQLHLSPPERIRQEVFTGAGYKIISIEELPQYAADHMFITVFHAKEGGAYAAQIMNSPQWKSLPAVRGGQVYFNDHGLFYNWDPASTEAQLEKVVQLLMS